MAGQSVAFRVDASIDIGTGHFMRCLTLAGALKKRGAQVRFISRQLPGYLRDVVVEKGHEPMVMAQRPCSTDGLDELAHAAWLGTSQAIDASDCAVLLGDRVWDWLVVDHYALDARWESALRPSARKILAIDDIADRQHDCDALLDQNFYLDRDTRYSGKVPRHCRLLLGPHYAMLREEFRALRAQVKPRAGPVKRILVFFGGVDPANCTGRAIEALASLRRPGLHVDVVIGSQHPCRAQLESECARHGFQCHVQTDRMAELMACADLGVGAGGSASWERCCLGLPALLVALADNQIDIAKALDSCAACVFLGTMETATVGALRHAIAGLCSSQERLKSLSERSYALADGLGVDRVCQEMIFQR